LPVVAARQPADVGVVPRGAVQPAAHHHHHHINHHHHNARQHVYSATPATPHHCTIHQRKEHPDYTLLLPSYYHRPRSHRRRHRGGAGAHRRQRARAATTR
ncbi:hypothetical protein LOZ44_006867, partial [Ophidiomyces ophidiicola]